MKFSKCVKTRFQDQQALSQSLPFPLLASLHTGEALERFATAERSLVEKCAKDRLRSQEAGVKTG